MVTKLIQTCDSNLIEKNLRANNILKETELLNIARLTKILVDLFVLDKQFQKMEKYEGREVELYFPHYKLL
ncbi:MAG: hypothetical protein ACFFAH_04300 [Promethearchaeota archaeon]